ncbi:hypothetical protein C4D60_Mb00t12140 [Musa balbisiana]|uniref:Uncharacterized protein n=2 Tax=Musa TaxID=4640 RepID=A0A4S8I682_MUSBA|nr:hypothetical protein C4D60_Mb00t16500 [Musa balbisiana]URD82776.1 hypothetical protein MUK42_00959 [Musa troglodytarum]THU43123.1 hypothetical protein C4D60_Mb00t10160 [Musa balbisiana]THU43397.1 hypothetical protein C4D60_Mb00t01200 [Musa balbisiana]THU43627.1 hypothetical protein C4D60_Mb00t03700 [Musa balbisiana]
MDRYVVTFYLGLGIGVIGPAFDISIGIWVPYSLLFWASIESRNRYPPDNSNRSNLMSDPGLYDMTDR